MDAPLAHVSSRPQSPQPYPFLANNVWADYRRPPSRWPWIVVALLTGVTLAAFVTDWEDLSFFRSNAAHKEPKLLPTTLAAAPMKKTEETATNSKAAKEPDTILQVDRQGEIPKLPGSTPEVAKHFQPLGLEQKIPKASSPELTLQTGIIRLPPLSILRIYFPKPYREAPVVKLMSETGMPSEVTIDEITVQCVVIRNAHVSNECYFRYYAEGKLKDEKAGKDRMP
ncbi:MAG: hypothetical protein QM703_02660 [Gemmatales bacterium]